MQDSVAFYCCLCPVQLPFEVLSKKWNNMVSCAKMCNATCSAQARPYSKTGGSDAVLRQGRSV